MYRHRIWRAEGSIVKLRTMAPDGSNDAWLAEDSAGPGPDWSPDGSLLILPTMENAMETIRCDGTGRTRIPLPAGIGSRGPKWAPDGRRVVFETFIDNRFHIMLLHLSEAIGGELLFDQHPDWSPDGSRIVFDSLRDKEFWAEQPDPIKKRGALTADLHMMTPEGVYRGNLTQSRDDESEPAWSPDGRYLAYVWRSPNASAPQLTVRDLDTGRGRKLTDPDLGVFEPSWSPDGRQIVFSAMDWRRLDTASVNVYVIDRDGGPLTQLTHYERPAGAGSPTWFDPGLTVSVAGKLSIPWGELKQ